MPFKLLIVFALMAAALMPGKGYAADRKLSIAATTGMVADTVRSVAGDRAVVEALMGPGIDPHLYRQTRSDVIKLSKADVIVHNGLYLEAQLEDLLRELSVRKPVIAFAEAVPPEKRLQHDEYKDKFDPHIWMDPELWSLGVSALAAELSKADPEGKAVYEANAANFQTKLASLARYAQTALNSVPADSRVLITAHDAFKYFGRAYGFEVLGIQGISTESEAGLKRVEELVDLLVKRKIAAIFVESSVSDRNVRALIEGTAARGHTVKIGGELFSDAMGAPGTYEGTYPGMIDHNATVIARALGGTAPERGYAGRLGSGM